MFGVLENLLIPILLPLYLLFDHPGPRHVEYFHVRIAGKLSDGNVMSLDVDAVGIYSRMWSVFPYYNKKIATASVDLTSATEHFCVGNLVGSGNDRELTKSMDLTVQPNVELRPPSSYTYLFARANANQVEAQRILNSYRIRGDNHGIVDRLWKVGNNEVGQLLQGRYSLFSDNCGHGVKALLSYRCWCFP